jgi:hypothetical protein
VGLDFITKCTPSFERFWDRSREEFAEPDLFRRHPQIEGRTFRVSQLEGVTFVAGEEVLLRWCENELMAFRGRNRAGVLTKPPLALLDAIRQSDGVLCARVNRVHSRSGAADVSVIP